jgi:DnaK suppressor protein
MDCEESPVSKVPAKNVVAVKVAQKAAVKSSGNEEAFSTPQQKPLNPLKTTSEEANATMPIKKKSLNEVASGSVKKTVTTRQPDSKAEAGTSPAPVELPVPINRFNERFSPVKILKPMTPEIIEPLKITRKVDPKLANAWKTKTGKELTDEEVMSMPEEEYMSAKQLQFFRHKLQVLKDDLLSNAGETTEHLREDTSIVPDPADRATIEEEHALELRTRDRERKLLKKISQAIVRIDASEYGYCDETGEPIGLGRLIARPTATLSLEAQQRRELKQRMFGD